MHANIRCRLICRMWKELKGKVIIDFKLLLPHRGTCFIARKVRWKYRRMNKTCSYGKKSLSLPYIPRKNARKRTSFSYDWPLYQGRQVWPCGFVTFFLPYLISCCGHVMSHSLYVIIVKAWKMQNLHISRPVFLDIELVLCDLKWTRCDSDSTDALELRCWTCKLFLKKKSLFKISNCCSINSAQIYAYFV